MQEITVTPIGIIHSPYKQIEGIPVSRQQKWHSMRHEIRRGLQVFSCIQEHNSQNTLKWDLLILVTLSTAMRRGELLNCVWRDIDFEGQTILISPKQDTPETWEWLIKDTDCRILPLTEELTTLLINHQSKQPEGYPYVFIPPARYDWIQHRLRKRDKWTYSDSRLVVVRNFEKQFKMILERANIKEGTFHDLRKTAICNWLSEGLREYEVMRLAGHSDFRTTHKYYLAVTDDLRERAREVNGRGLCKKMVQIGARDVLSYK